MAMDSFSRSPNGMVQTAVVSSATAELACCPIADGIQPDNFSGKVEPGHLLFATGQRGIGLDGARAHGIDRLEGLALVKQVVSPLQRAIALDNVVELIQMAILNRRRQANWVQRAFGTVRLAQGADDDGRSVAGLSDIVGS
jgi:hypothetical protein